MSVSEIVTQQASGPVCLFVGQVPKNMLEHDLRAVLEEFGPIETLTIIKDHATGLSKGCAFVTYHNGAHASAAQAALHGQRTLPGASNPLQVSPARQRDTSSKGVRGPSGHRHERQEQRKLFIGMVSRSTTDEQLRSMFEPFGRIEDCIILRNADQSSKGCAFVSYSSMEECQKAILALNNSQIMAGCTAPLVVRFADTPAQKEERQRKRIQSIVMQGQGPNPMMPANNAPVGMMGAAQPVMGVQQPMPQPGSGAVGGLQNALAPTMQQLVQHQQQLQAQQQAISQALQMLGLNYPANGMPQSENAAPVAPGAGPTSFSAVPGGAAQPAVFGATPGAPNVAGAPGMPAPAVGVPGAPAISAPANFGYPASNSSAPAVPQSGNVLVGNRSGPEGANLFIYHLPETISDHDLIQMFAHYGTILSAKVFMDKATGLSKGFGFVSYDNASSAQTAIQAMNGLQIGPRRIKVQLKKSKEVHRPY